MANFVFTPNVGSVSITATTFPVVVAPAVVFLEATGHTGFSAYEGSGGTGGFYDGAWHEIEHYWTVNGEPLAQYTAPENFLSEWSNANKAYGPKVAFRFPDAGSYTIDLWCVDRNGITASASTSTITVQDPDTYYDGTKTICFSDDPAETWAGKPTGAREITEWTTTSIENQLNGAGPHRLLFKRGSDVTIPAAVTRNVRIDSGRSLEYVGAWGTGAKPILRNTHVTSGGVFIWNGGVQNDQITVTDIDTRGNWDSTRETGYYAASRFWEWGGATPEPFYTHVHNCDFNGFTTGQNLDGNMLDSYQAMTDCTSTNWINYACFAGDTNGIKSAFIGNKFTQDVDALNGQLGKGGGGNQHGPIRLSSVDFSYIACNDLFSRTGWSSHVNNLSFDETADQPCVRGITSGQDGCALNIERNVMEGGYHIIKLGAQNDASVCAAGNFLLDRNLLIGTTKSYDEEIRCHHAASTVRNTIFYQNTITTERAGRPAFCGVGFREPDGTYDAAFYSDQTMAAYNNTALHLSDVDEVYDVAIATYAEGAFDQTFFQAASVIENNYLHAPNLTVTPVTASPTINTATNFSGITTRYKGVKYGFQNLILGLGDAALPGSDVVDGGTWLLSYTYVLDNLVGEAAGSATSQAYWQNVETEATNEGYTLKHFVNIKSSAAWSSVNGAAGGIDVAFNAGGILITNNTGSTWTLPTSTDDAQLWKINLDRSPIVPTFVAGTDSDGQSVPIPRPTTLPPSDGASTRCTSKDFFLVGRVGVKGSGALLP